MALQRPESSCVVNPSAISLSPIIEAPRRRVQEADRNRSNRVRILYANAGLDLHGGTTTANTHFLAVANALQDAGHDVTVSCARVGPRRPVPGLETPHRSYRVPGAAFRWYALGELLRILWLGLHLLAVRPDVLYVRKDTLDLAPAIWARLLGVRLVLEFNGDVAAIAPEHGVGPRLLRAILRVERECVRAAAAAIVVAPALRESIAARHPARWPPDRVIENGVDTGLFTPSPLPDGPLRIGFVGSLKPWHGVETLVEAVAAANERDAAWDLHVWGDGPGRTAIQDAGPATLHGRVPHESIPAAIRSCHAMYLSVEAAHGFSPLKLQEYLACGRPVVVGAADNIARLVPDGAAFWFRPGDAAALTDVLVGLSTRPDRLVAAAKAAAAARVRTWADVARETVRVLEAA